MKISISEKHSFDNNYLIWRTICIDSDDCTRGADIELNHYPESAERHYNVSLYKGSATTISNIKIEEWHKAKKLALAWVEG